MLISFFSNTTSKQSNAMYLRIIYRLAYLHLLALILLYVTSSNAAPMERRSSESSQRSQHSQSSTSSHLSRISEEARIMNLQRQTEALFGPDDLTQPVRHRSFDDIHNPSVPTADDVVYYSRAGPPTMVRLGASTISLPDLNQPLSEGEFQIQDSDWLTPRAERQIQELFPSMSSRNQQSGSASQSPRSLTPLARVRDASQQRTPMFQSPPPPDNDVLPHRANICELCKKRFPNVAAFRDHQMEHLNDEQERQTYICPICETEFLGKTTMIHSHIPLHYRFNTQTNRIDLI